MLRLVLIACLLAPLAAAAGEAGYTTRDLELREEPAPTGKSAGTLAKGAKVEILAEQKAWSQVKSGTVTGWTLSFYVMKGEPAAQAGFGSRLSDAFSLGTRRRAETSGTLGIRGLDEEDLASAQFNAEELKVLDSFAVPRIEADAFAKTRKLQAQKVEYLKEGAK